MIVQATAASGKSIAATYGFDFTADSRSATFSLTPSGSNTHVMPRAFITGTGNVFQYYIPLAQTAAQLKVSSVTLKGKEIGEKVAA